MTERALTRTTLARLRALPGCWAVKSHQSRYQRGEPDLHGAIRGRAFFLELKVPGRRPTPLQATRLRMWRATGALADWFTSADAAVEAVRALGERQDAA